MRLGILLSILLMSLTACAGTMQATATATLSPSPAITDTAQPTNTISNEQLTAYATYRPTLPATFTPTFTPSVTLSPTITLTPVATATRTPMPENLFCPTFDTSPFAPQGRPIGIRFSVPQDFTVFIEIMLAENREMVDSARLPNQSSVTLIFDPRSLAAGNYIWRVTLEDESRTGMCPLEGEFTIVAPPATPTAELTAEVTGEATAEVTAETSTATATRRPSSTPRPTRSYGN